MSYDYGRYYSADLAIDLYMELINVVKNKRPNITIYDAVAIPRHPVVFSRVLAASYSASIARTNELILEQDSKSSEEYETIIEKVMNECQIFEKIKPKQPMSKSELKQQIKNALSHAEYTIASNDNEPCFLDISSPKIEGKITLKELETITIAYSKIYNALTSHKVIYDAYDLLHLETNNKRILRKVIELIRKGKLSNENYPPSVTVFGVDGTNEESLSQEQQQFIYDYIMYVGLQGWANLSPDEKMKNFVYVIRPQLEKKISPFGEGQNTIKVLDYFLFNGKGDTTPIDFYHLQYEFPIIYADLMLELGFLCLNHIKESQSKDVLQYFNYHNISLKGIKYEPASCVRMISKEEQTEKHSKELSILYKVAEKERNALAKKYEEYRLLEGNSKINQNKKQVLLERKRQRIIELEANLSNTTSKIYDTEDMLENSEDYIETNDFFKHLRNSISHGFYKVDISPGLRKKNLGETIFHFEDWDISKTDRTKRTKVFEADITGDQLMAIYKELANRLIASANTFDEQEDKRIIFNDCCNNPRYNDKISAIYKKYTNRGATVIKPQ